MGKILKYIIGALVVFLLISVAQNWFQKRKIDNLKAEKDRLTENQRQLIADKQQQTTLILTQREVTGKVLAERDSLANALKIRPKTITKIVKETIIDIDTVNKIVYVNPVEDNLWFLSDSDKCWYWEASAMLNGADLNIERTYFSYENRIDDVFWWSRRKILFLRIGKKEYFQKLIPKCGTVNTRIIEIKKK
jgi:hypothetical protein